MKKICLVLLAILSITSFAKNMVITSIQPLYSLTSYLVEGTDIQVKSVFDSSVSMDTSIDALLTKNLIYHMQKTQKLLLVCLEFGLKISYTVRLDNKI